MGDILRELGNMFEQNGFWGTIGSLLVMIPMGIIFWLAAKANQDSMDKNKESEKK